MARTLAGLPEGTRITDFISLGVLTRSFPREKVHEILGRTGKESRRQRDLPAHVVVYYAIALALYFQVSCSEVLRCLLEGLRWLMGPTARIKVAGTSGISQARVRVGEEPLRILHDEMVVPVAVREEGRVTKGAWYRGWRVVSLDGSTLDVADTERNEEAFHRPSASRGKSAFPQIRFVSLVENGTRVLFGSRMNGCRSSEATLAKEVIEKLGPGMLCLADRYFYGFALWNAARGTGAHLVWRVSKTVKLPCMKQLPDGSYLSKVHSSSRCRARDKEEVVVRVIEYRLKGAPEAEQVVYRLITTILDPAQAPAEELAALYHERWEIETALDELKTHLRGARMVLRSKRPDLVRQEFYGLMLAHFAIRGLMHEAALGADMDADSLSFVHAVHVVRRRLPMFVAFPPSGPSRAP